MFGQCAKRLRHTNYWPESDLVPLQQQVILDEPNSLPPRVRIHDNSFHDPKLGSQFQHVEFAPLDTSINTSKVNQTGLRQSRKRTLDAFADTPQLRQFAASHCPSACAGIPDESALTPPKYVENPYVRNGVIRHAKLNRSHATKRKVPTKSMDGLLKFRDISLEHGVDPIATTYGTTRSSQQDSDERRQWISRLRQLVPWLPPNFGRSMTLSPAEEKLFSFYVGPFCDGRTIIPSQNGLRCDIVPMADSNVCVKHALLALAATYFMDFQPSEEIEQLAQYHHRNAVLMIGMQLNDRKYYKAGNEAALLGAIVLMNVDDVVNWEAHDGEKTPKWFRGLQAARRLLKASDAAAKYSDPQHVQNEDARMNLGAMLAECDIFARVVAQLDPSESECPHRWLVEGQIHDQTRIRGLIGMCPKLLHIIAKITFLCNRLKQDPAGVMWIRIADFTKAQLRNVRQWSNLGNRVHRDTEELLKTCTYRATEVADAASVTSLGAECHALAARLYLLCRFYRLPKSHPEVRQNVRLLCRCIDVSPRNGPLFTMQAPFFAIFFAGTVAELPEDRAVVSEWCITVSAAARGNVPLMWKGLQHIWASNDALGPEPPWDDSVPIGERHPWWEDMVDLLQERMGQLSIK